MFNPQSYAVDIEKLFNFPFHSADKIRKNPLEFLKSTLDGLYVKSEEKARLIDAFDEKYSKYKDTILDQWDEADIIQMIKDLREIKNK